MMKFILFSSGRNAAKNAAALLNVRAFILTLRASVSLETVYLHVEYEHQKDALDQSCAYRYISKAYFAERLPEWLIYAPILPLDFYKDQVQTGLRAAYDKQCNLDEAEREMAFCDLDCARSHLDAIFRDATLVCIDKEQLPRTQLYQSMLKKIGITPKIWVFEAQQDFHRDLSEFSVPERSRTVVARDWDEVDS